MEFQGEKTGLYLSGLPVIIEDCNIAITQPKIKDIVAYGEESFLVATNILAHPELIVSKMQEGNSELEYFSDFQLLLVVLREKSEVSDSIKGTLDLLFPDYTVEIDDAAINFKKEFDEGKVYTVGQVQIYNYESFANIINSLFSPQLLRQDKDPEYNPVNEAANAIAEKLKRGREKAREINAKKNKDNVPQSLFASYVSTLSIGMSMDVNIFFNYTPFQLYDAYNRYFKKVQCDLYTKVSTTPLMDVSGMDEPEE